MQAILQSCDLKFLSLLKSKIKSLAHSPGNSFVYLCGGIGVAAVTFLAFPIFIFILIGIPASAVAFLLAFYPVNNRPFSIFMESFFSFL